MGVEAMAVEGTQLAGRFWRFWAATHSATDLGGPSLGGVLIATEGAGSLVGATLNPGFVARWGTARAILLAELGGALFALLMPAGSGGWALGLFAVGNAGFATGVVITSINTRTHRQVASPPDLLSRVMATVRFISWGVIPLGALASLTSPRTSLWVFCLFNLVSPLILWSSSIRGRRDLADPTCRASGRADNTKNLPTSAGAQILEVP